MRWNARFPSHELSSTTSTHLGNRFLLPFSSYFLNWLPYEQEVNMSHFRLLSTVLFLSAQFALHFPPLSAQEDQAILFGKVLKEIRIEGARFTHLDIITRELTPIVRCCLICASIPSRHDIVHEFGAQARLCAWDPTPFWATPRARVSSRALPDVRGHNLVPRVCAAWTVAEVAPE